MRSQKGNIVILVVLVILAIGSVSAAIFSFIQSRAQTDKQVEVIPEVTPFGFSPDSSATSLPTPAQAVAQSTAKVTFENDAVFSTAVKADITSKVINPFLDYYTEQNNAGYVKELSITKNTQKSSTEFPYMASYVFENNVKGGFLITSSAKGVGWWSPECLNSCSFSPSFASKYPEIVMQTK
jgi:hypothetical protein